jgi:hypothetical protein
MKKIIFVIDNDLYIRNYIDTKVTNFLSKNFKLYFIANHSIRNKKKIYNLKNFLGFFKYSSFLENKINIILRQKLWALSKKSKTIKFKVKLYLRFIKYFEQKKNINYYFKLPLFLISYLKRLLIYFYDTSILFRYIRFLYEKFIPKNDHLDFFLNKINPDLIILPSSNDTVCKYDLMKLTKNKKTKILCLIDNWDNISSKSAVTQDNFYYGVWGQQSKEHATYIHGIKRNKIFNIGTPRFENYFHLRNKKINNSFNFKYILFLESSCRYLSETQLVPLINNILEKNKEFKHFKLIYRPHPWRQASQLINFQGLNKIVLDPQLSSMYKKKKLGLSFQPDLAYYPGLIKNAEFVISGPTTMVIESLILNKLTLLLNFDDKNNFYNPRSAIRNFQHFDGIQKIKLIKLNNQKDRLEHDMLNCLLYNKKINNINVSKELKYYLYSDSKTYNRRLKEVVNKIL